MAEHKKSPADFNRTKTFALILFTAASLLYLNGCTASALQLAREKASPQNVEYRKIKRVVSGVKQKNGDISICVELGAGGRHSPRLDRTCERRSCPLRPAGRAGKPTPRHSPSLLHTRRRGGRDPHRGRQMGSQRTARPSPARRTSARAGGSSPHRRWRTHDAADRSRASCSQPLHLGYNQGGFP